MKKLLLTLWFLPAIVGAEVVDADLLIVGGNESACAAAVQASRLGVKRIVLVNDIEWLGGQFSAEGVGCPDEWTVVNNARTHFPRSGMFLEVLRRIRAHNSSTYGMACPGNAFCGTETIEPAAAARIFSELLEPCVRSGALRIESGWQPMRVVVEGARVDAVEFEPTNGGASRLKVKARITMDASDWGDVIRLSGASYGAGPDLRSRFGEASAPESYDDAGRQEMNPISWCMVLRETCGQPASISQPSTYHAASFAALDKIAPWVNSDMSGGIYSPSGNSPYTHRRLVDRWHNGFAPGTEATFLNYPAQDYPLCQLPKRVVDALENNEAGASKKNIVEMTHAQRRIVFDDVKQHSLGMLYHLQTAVHERVGDFPQSFRYMRLSEEFGTPDKLPHKPVVHAGASGVGTAAIQICRAMGTWIAVTCSTNKVQACRDLGANLVIDYSKDDFAAAIAQATDGKGVDVVLDVIGGDYTVRNVACLALKGRIIQVGTMAGPSTNFNVASLMPKRASITGTVLRPRPPAEKIAVSRAFADALLPDFDAGVLKPVIDTRFTLEQIVEAHRHMEANANIGKIVVTVAP